MFTLRVDSEDSDQIIENLRKQAGVKYCTFDVEGEDSSYIELETGNDEYMDEMWHLKRHNVFNAHKYQKGNFGIVVAIEDSGINMSHEEFSGQPWSGFAIDYGDNWDERGGHGMGCACMVGAQANSGKIMGAAPGVHVFSLARAGITYTNAIAAIQYAKAHGFQIFNASYILATDAEMDIVLTSEWESYIQQGGLIFHAAGNSGLLEISLPVADGAIYIGGTIDIFDTKHPYSTFGPHVQIIAPMGPYYGTYTYYPETTGYQLIAGTSFAGPLAAGLCALMWSENPTLSNTEIKEIYYSTVDPIKNPTCKSYFPGCYGIPNAYKGVLKSRSTNAEYEHRLLPFIQFHKNIGDTNSSVDIAIANSIASYNISGAVYIESGVFGQNWDSNGSLEIIKNGITIFNGNKLPFKWNTDYSVLAESASDFSSILTGTFTYDYDVFETGDCSVNVHINYFNENNDIINFIIDTSSINSIIFGIKSHWSGGTADDIGIQVTVGGILLERVVTPDSGDGFSKYYFDVSTFSGLKTINLQPNSDDVPSDLKIDFIGVSSAPPLSSELLWEYDAEPIHIIAENAGIKTILDAQTMEYTFFEVSAVSLENTIALTAWDGASIFADFDNPVPTAQRNSGEAISIPEGASNLYCFASDAEFTSRLQIFAMSTIGGGIFTPNGYGGGTLLSPSGNSGGTIIPWN
jgi:hypothetical protein